MSSNEMYIYEYSEKSIAVFGNTTPHKEILEEYGGKYNRNLKKDGENTPGWIFVKSKKEKIQKYINSNTFGTNTVTPVMVQSNTTLTPRLLSNSNTSNSNTSNSNTSNFIERLEIIERILNITNIQSSDNFNSLLQRLENIEKIVVVKKIIQIENHEDIDINGEETVVPKRRLLSKNIK
jgi:hypothetical protein